MNLRLLRVGGGYNHLQSYPLNPLGTGSLCGLDHISTFNDPLQFSTHAQICILSASAEPKTRHFRALIDKGE